MKYLREIVDGATDRNRAMNVDDKISSHYYYNGDSYEGDEPAHAKAIRNYQKSGVARAMNGYHWAKHHGEEYEHDDYTNHELHSKSEKLDAAIASHKSPINLKVYSGVKVDPRKHMNSEGIVHHPAYLSTSLRERVAHYFAGNHVSKSNLEKHIMKIHVPKGHPTAYAANLGLTNEREMILPRGTNLKHIKTESKETDFGTMVHTHHMKVV